MGSVMKNHYDCIAVGGGIAGSTVAYHLARLGYNIAVLEKTKGPHHKVCGEFLSFEALEYLLEMGISLNGDIPVVKYFQLFSSRFNSGFTFPFPGRGISRYKLDEELLNNAKMAGADVFRGECMRSYQEEDDGLFRIETGDRVFYARHLFMATGKHDHSKEDKRHGKDHSYIGLKTHIHFRSPDRELRETTILFSFPGGYVGICPVEKDMINFCIIIKKKVYKSLNSDFDRVMEFLRRSNPKFDSIIQQADFIDHVYAVGHLPYGFLRRQSRLGNVYFLGDQHMVIPSFTGDGMAIALCTAKNCAYEFDNRQKGPKFQIDPLQKIMKTQMNWAMSAHAIFNSLWATNAGLSIPMFNSFLIKKIFHETRISKMKDILHDHTPAFAKDNYSRG
jgi:menaquinone-9 beta-reductase